MSEKDEDIKQLKWQLDQCEDTITKLRQELLKMQEANDKHVKVAIDAHAKTQSEFNKYI